jgi:protein-S-isoprenylcysteine O-methyltransferase Ste14
MAHRAIVFGTIILLLGIQFRMVETFVLTPKASHFVEQKLSQRTFASDPYNYSSYPQYDSLLMAGGPGLKKQFTPPRWLGWAMVSVGAVMLLHGLTLKKG